MITFWVVSALLMAGALLFLVPPLLGGRARNPASANHEMANLTVLRDQLRELETEHEGGLISPEQYARARGELEKRVLEESGSASAEAVTARPPIGVIAGVVLLLPMLAIPLYLYLGNPQALNPAALAAQASSGQGGHSLTAEQVEAMVEQLAARLRQNPDDNEGWVMLARTYNALGRYAEAAEAFRTLSNRLPGDAQILADYADTLAMAQGRQLLGEPEAIIARALQADAKNIKALALAGTAAFERKDYAKAIEHWERVAAQVPPDSNTARSIAASITEARNRMGGAPAAEPAAVASAPLRGRVQLAPGLLDTLQPDDTVFIFARAASGPRMPLAILRKQVRDLPIDFSLDDSMAMAPSLRLSSYPQVVVGARISRSGNATPQPGDIQAFSDPIASSANGVMLTLGAEASAPSATATGAASASLTGKVEMSPELSGKVSPGDTVFIFARAAEGPRMPLAILRKQVRDLPLEFKLDDSMAMAPTMKLSAFPQVVVGARISKSGQATPQPGDYEAVSAPVGSSADGVKLVINQPVR